MGVNYQLSQEDDHSVTVTFDLHDYLPLFMHANISDKKFIQSENKSFLTAHRDLYSFFHDFEGIILMENMVDECLKHYRHEEREQIKASPAFQLLHDSFREIFKNTIDSFLEEHLRNPNDKSTDISLNFNIEKLSNNVKISFADSGRGFPKAICKELDTEAKQLAYIETSKISNKRTQKIQGLLGGGAYGLRQLICQILTGKELAPGIKGRRATTFTSEIHFKNNNNHYYQGASIQIVTQLAPIPLINNTMHITTPVKGKEASYTPSPETMRSRSSHHTHSTESLSTLSSSSSDQSKRRGLTIEVPNEAHHFEKNAQIVPKRVSNPTKPSSSGLSLDMSFHQDNDKKFIGSSPILPSRLNRDQKQHDRKLHPLATSIESTDPKGSRHKLGSHTPERLPKIKSSYEESTTDYRHHMKSGRPKVQQTTGQHSKKPAKP